MMTKILKTIMAVATAAVAAAASFTMIACHKHTHKWQWHRTETEHWQECSCGETQNYGSHDDCVCEECAEFKAFSLGFTSGGDAAHADFANEANVWFPKQAKKYGFIYDFTTDLANVWFPKQAKKYGFIYDFTTDFGAVNADNLSNYDVVILLNNRPSEAQMPAFKDFMDNGGGCLAFHAAGFAMWNSNDPEVPEEDRPFTAPNEWEDWFQNTLLRSGVYGYCPRVGVDTAQGAYYWNTWNPTSEPLHVETHDHYATANLGDDFMSAPCEWYEWHNDLFNDEDTTVLVTMNPTEEQPAGDDNRADLAHQIWKDGHHPIAWANKNYNMVYMNWGHNLQPYNIPTGSPVGESETFSGAEQCQFTLNALFGVAGSSIQIEYAAD